MGLELDHLVVAAASLEEGNAFVSESLGLDLQTGGRHERMGTHNALLRLNAGQYLEVIAIDPEASPPARARWFGLDSFSGEPRLVHWVARVSREARVARMARLAGAVLGDLEHLRLPEHGPVLAMSRGEFSWRITVPDDGSLPGGGVIPTLIRWDSGPHIPTPNAMNPDMAGSSHPTDFLEDQQCRLIGLEATHPNPVLMLEQLSKLGLERSITLRSGPVSLLARLQVAAEIRLLGSAT
jgi:Glyoxalase-like domain